MKTLTLLDLLGRSKKSATCGLMLSALLASSEPRAEQPQELDGPYPGRMRTALVVGVTNWDSINDLKPDNGGGFDSDGSNLELSLHAVMWPTRYGDLFVGLDIGLFFHTGYLTDRSAIDASGFYLTPSLKWRFGQFGHFRTYLEAGAGYYKIELSEADYWLDGDDIWKERTLGGYLGLSFDLPWSIVYLEPTLGVKVHYFDAGSAGGIGPDAGDVNGPLYMFQFGFAIGDY